METNILSVLDFLQDCLNRTMQYGNSGQEKNMPQRRSRFKSYYVVWKLFSISIIFFPDRFKSYYVVWKLKIIKIVCKMGGLFKSYYVVWKLFFPSLNCEKVEAFKSYYVVWKLVLFVIFEHTSILFKSYYVVWKPQTSPQNIVSHFHV